ncbi:hypothetical protein [Haloarcula argentinensis]|uniref:Uncharacterized protein n=1 Tax=Haloarcula argentinensis TaxID=43776 RepID=A0A847UKF2_HALAR|nr:hypothetical protein [Haloarcula argentinensis]NLV12200.1 hypothetical protein [Haloarcula argentinensis]
MNDIDRRILSFMRDVEVPEQGAFYLEFINDNISRDIRQSHLERLESIGMVQETGGEIGNSKTYFLTAEGLQAITTEDLNITLSDTNEKLNETVDELQDMQRSNTRSSAVQTIFSFSIILFTLSQVINSMIDRGTEWLIIGVIAAFGALLISAVIVIGRHSLIKSATRLTV